MLYKRLIINGKEYLLAVSQAGSGAPAATDPGAEGVLYMDTDTEELYKCTGGVDGAWEWKKLAEGGSDYKLPIGGENLGGVKNGGNVVINEDGTMDAPVPEQKYRKLVSFATTEEIAANTGMEFSTADDGTPFDCQEILVEWKCPKGPAGYVTFRANGEGSSHFWDGALSDTSREIRGIIRFTALVDKCLLEAITNASTYNGRYQDSPFPQIFEGNFDSINSIVLTHFSGTYGAGLSITIWGR